MYFNFRLDLVFLKLRFILVLVLLGSVSYGQVSKLEKNVDAFYLEHRTSPYMGMAVVVVQDGQVLFQKAYGYADYENQVPFSLDTKFAVGSVTKSFTAALASRRQENGQVDLSKPVKDYLPEFGLSDLKLSKDISFEDLLSHRSTIPNHPMLWLYNKFSRDELFQNLKHIQLQSSAEKKIRTNYEYSNLGYIVMGRALEILGGSSFEQQVKAQLLRPLQMNSSTLSKRAFTTDPLAAKPYVNGKRVNFWIDQMTSPTGGVYSTPKDMTKWLNFISTFDSGHEGVLSSQSRQDMWTPRVLTHEDSYHLDSAYGLGLYSFRMGSDLVVSHTGGVTGYISHLSFIPNKKLGILILVNDYAASWKFHAIGNYNGQESLPSLIYQKVIGKKWKPLTSTRKKSNAEPVQAVPELRDLSPEEVFELEARFSTKSIVSSSYGQLEVRRKQGKLDFRFGDLKLALRKSSHSSTDFYLVSVYGEIFPISIKPDQIEIHFQNDLMPEIFHFVPQVISCSQIF